MATFANLKRRVHLLMILARLALPDALRRGGQAPAVAIGLAALYLVVATASTLALLPLLFGIEDDELRRNVLHLCALFVVLLWLLGQVVPRLPVTWLLDLEALLQLPVGYRDLYLLRLALSLIGYWLIGLGPAFIYILATQSVEPTSLLVGSAALLTLVLLLGRITAILTLTIDRLIENAVGLLGLFLACTGFLQGIAFAASVLDGEAEIESVTASIRESTLLTATGFTPPGFIVAILDSPGAVSANIARLGALLVLLGAAILLERRLLLRRYLSLPGGDGRTASPVMPLARLLRRQSLLSPASCLALVEVEAAFRAKGVRWAYVMCLAYATYSSVDLFMGLIGSAFLTVFMLNSIRTEKPPPSCQVWRESLTLPPTAFQIFRTPARVPFLLVVPAVLVAAGVGFTRYGWNEWRLGALAAILVVALFLFADGAYSLVQLYWPKRNVGSAAPPEMKNLAASILAGLPMMAFFFLAMIVWRVEDGSEHASSFANITVAATLFAAALVWRVATARQRREIESRAHELLLQDSGLQNAKPP